MNIQQLNTPRIVNSNTDNKRAGHSDVQFTGLLENCLTMGLRYLDTNQAVGANLVDLGSMVIPRTWVDFRDRGPAAGLETGRREITGTTNHSLVGVYGTLGGLAVAAATGLNSKFGIRAHKIFADDNTMNIIAKSWHDAVHSSNGDLDSALKSHIDTLVDRIRVFNTDADRVNGYVKIPDKAKKLVSDSLFNALKNADAKTALPDDVAKYVYNIITAHTGGEKNVLLLAEEGGKDAGNTLKTLVKNIFNLTNAFKTDKAFAEFKGAAKFEANDLLNRLRRMNSSRSKIGLGIATLVGVSTQPINMYLTKKKTGSDGFVGVEGREKDKSHSFKVLKGIMALIFGAGTLSTITANPRKFASKLQFQGVMPTINQLKFVYGMTITSRLLAARDKDELRESAVKDSLGFLNLLVLGALVSKYSARIFNSKLVNKLDDTGKSFWDKFKNELSSSLKTRDEVLMSTLQKQGIDVVKDGKALPVRELLKKVNDITDPAVKDALKEQLRALNFSQAIGYAYSGIVLGLGIPKLNIYMTKQSEAKRKARLAEMNAAAGKDSSSGMLKPDNQKFLKEFALKDISLS